MATLWGKSIDFVIGIKLNLIIIIKKDNFIRNKLLTYKNK